MKVAILGGGNMGGAVGFGAVDKGIVGINDIKISFPSPHIAERFKQSDYNITFTQSNIEAVEDADLILIAVKPWLAEEIFKEIAPVLKPNQMIASIIAGLSFDKMSEYLANESSTLFRVIPNTAISIGESTTFIAQKRASEAQLSTITSLFDALGEIFIVTEEQMTAVTALSSCGIAYAFKYIDAATKGGVQLGIEPSQALKIVLQTVKGALSMLTHNNSEPQSEIDKVTTPGGITLKGLDAMEKGGFTNSVIDGLKASR